TVFLPQITEYLNYRIFTTKVDDSVTSLSRLEFIKICASVFGPILTVMVFVNTLNMQKKTEQKQNELEVKQAKAENERAKKELLTQIDREFYFLLNMFIEIQKDQNAKQAVIALQKLAIFNEKGFNQDYAFTSKDLSDSEIGSTIEQSGPLKGTVEYIKFETFDVSKSMGNYQTKTKDVATSLHDQKVAILNEQYEKMQIYLGRYFKMFHRIVKTLNEYYDDYNDFDVKRYTKYIGTLRTQISPAEFQVILFNSLYIKRGFGLGIQLIGSGFFGDDFDFETNQHFETSINEQWFLSLSTVDSDNSIKRQKLSEYIKELGSVEYKKIANFESLYKLFNETKL
ncbi:TPA: hypothetical protein OOI15_001528, partial [Enterococcus faecium]|nr:hypothetical protein [Enterococcus faecium]HCR4773119.1 hypothetical protein [Enterococcus faecium]